ncbi:MAG: hypothetical protein ACRDHX_02590 [Chloroflexota bacterium]
MARGGLGAGDKAQRNWPLGGLALLLVLAVAWLGSLVGEPLLILARNTPQLDGWSRVLAVGEPVQLVVAPTPGDADLTGALYLPGQASTRGAIMLVNGTEVPLGWRDPAIQTFARSLASLGHAVYVPDLPGIKDERITPSALSAVNADVAWFHTSGRAGRGTVALVGVCVGAALAMVAAEDPANHGIIGAVVGLDPYASLADVLEAATTDHGLNAAGGLAPFAMAPWVKAVVVRMIAIASLPDQGSRRLFEQALSNSPPNSPLQQFREQPPAGLSPAGLAWWRLLANRGPANFQPLLERLPAASQAELALLSPLTSAARLHVPVALMMPALDFAFPAGEGPALKQANPAEVSTTTSSALDHVTPALTPSRLAGYWQLLRFAIRANQLLG